MFWNGSSQFFALEIYTHCVVSNRKISGNRIENTFFDLRLPQHWEFCLNAPFWNVVKKIQSRVNSNPNSFFSTLPLSKTMFIRIIDGKYFTCFFKLLCYIFISIMQTSNQLHNLSNTLAYNTYRYLRIFTCVLVY